MEELFFVIEVQDQLFFVIELQESHPANPALFLFTEIQNGLWEGHLYKMHLLFLSLLSLCPLPVIFPLSFLPQERLLKKKIHFYETFPSR